MALVNRNLEVSTVACKPISVALDVEPPSQSTEVIFQLDKICNDDGTAEWKLHFELKKQISGNMVSIVKADVDINKEDHPTAAATAKNGLDDNQRAQADATGQTAVDKDAGQASQDDVNDQAGQIIPARDPNSPS
jgi:hypothetical protein